MILNDKSEEQGAQNNMIITGKKGRCLTECILPCFGHSYSSKTETEELQPPDRSHCCFVDELNKLSVDNLRIQKELEVVREGAIQAIIEKEEAIEELQNRISSIHSEAEDKRRLNYELAIRVDELELERRQLLRMISRVKDDHVNEVTHKNQLICEMGEELDSLKERMGQLIRSDHALTERLEDVEKQNIELESQLIQSNSELIRVKHTLKEYELLSTADHEEQSDRYFSDNNEFKNGQVMVVEEISISEEDLQIQHLQHEKELKQIRDHYDQLLADANIICEDEICESSLQSDRWSSGQILLLSTLQQSGNRRRSSIAAQLKQVQEEDNRVQSATKDLMESAITSYKDSGFSRLHFSYDERFNKENQCQLGRGGLTRNQLGHYEVLETVVEASDNSIAKQSKENLDETPLPENSVVEAFKAGKCNPISSRGGQPRSGQQKQPSSQISKGVSTAGLFVGWSAIALAGGLLLKYLTKGRPG